MTDPTQGVVVEFDGTVRRLTDKPITLEVMQQTVDGYIEAVGLSIAGVDATLFLNEEGKLHGFPVNRVATALARDYLFGGDWIAGNAIIVGAPDDEGYSTDLAETAMERIEQVSREMFG